MTTNNINYQLVKQRTTSTAVSSRNVNLEDSDALTKTAKTVSRLCITSTKGKNVLL